MSDESFEMRDYCKDYCLNFYTPDVLLIVGEKLLHSYKKQLVNSSTCHLVN